MNKSTLIASNADVWSNCTGSVQLCERFPAIESPDGMSETRLEGRAIHDVAKRMLTAIKTPGEQLILKSDVIDTFSPDGVLITDELYECANDYAREIMSVCDGNISKMNIEQFIDLSELYAGMYGYIDCWYFDDDAGVLYVWEGKFGHRHIPAFENNQLLCYVLGLLQQLGINGHADQHLRVSMRVFQPRSFHGGGPLDEWVILASELRALFNILRSRAAESRSDAAKCTTGPWCGSCSGRYACEALDRAAGAAVEYVRSVEGVTLTGNNLALELRILSRAMAVLKARQGGLEEQALSEIRTGKVLPGFAAQASYGRKRWKKDTPVDEVIMMGDLMGVDIRKPVELDTPAQAVKKGIDESVIILYSETPMTGFKLVEDAGTRARNVFTSEVK